MIAFYRVNRLSWLIGKLLVRVPFYSMVNLIAGRRVVPELIQGDFRGTPGGEALRLLDDTRQAGAMRAGFDEVAAALAGSRRPDGDGAAAVEEYSKRGNRACFVGLAGSALALRWRVPGAAGERRRGRASTWSIYAIDADINPRTQAITANVQMRFIPLDDNVTTASFELNNALNVSRIVDESGRQIPASRSTQDFSIRLSFPAPLQKGKPSTLTFTYDGRLTGTEDSPVYGIKFAAIHNDFAYLMYPARWFPINDYTVDRYTADMRITVPAGNSVVASGDESVGPGGRR